jgi:hypothetical protein
MDGKSSPPTGRPEAPPSFVTRLLPSNCPAPLRNPSYSLDPLREKTRLLPSNTGRPSPPPAEEAEDDSTNPVEAGFHVDRETPPPYSTADASSPSSHGPDEAPEGPRDSDAYTARFTAPGNGWRGDR